MTTKKAIKQTKAAVKRPRGGIKVGTKVRAGGILGGGKDGGGGIGGILG